MAKNVVPSYEKCTSIIEVLNETSLQLLEIREEHEIYKILAAALAKVIPGAYCLVSKLQPDKKHFRVVQMHGVEKYMEAGKLLLGKDPFEWDFPFEELVKKHREAFESRKLYHFEDGLYGVSVGTINKTVCKALEKLGGISHVFTTCFYMDNTYYGGLTLLIPKSVMKAGLMNQDAMLAIETLSNMATVLIHKLQANEKLIANREMLETTISAKDKVFSILAHDLRTPFNSIIGFAEILSNGNKMISEKDRLTYVNIIRESAVSTYKLLDNLLEWSRLQLDNYVIQKELILPKLVIDDCIELYQATAENKLITIRNLVHEDTKVYVDWNSIFTILRNLLNNALKYTPVGGSITFTSAKKHHYVELSIQDTGVGIQPDMLKKLFLVGENSSTPGTNKEKGTGLGLVLCKDLLDKNNGYIRIESEVGKGSTFTVGLQVQSAETLQTSLDL